MSDVFVPGVRVHVVGVGGAGMSGLALLLTEMGATVSGSDVVDSPVLDALRARGVAVEVGHAEHHLSDAQVVLWSPAVSPDNLELVAARRRGVTMLTRSQALAELGTMRPIVGLTGTHGKTTATSMMVQVMAASGRRCPRLVGAEVRGVGSNGAWGSDELVLEVDESYGTFALVAPAALGLLNVEADHLDHYGSLEALESAFAELVARTVGPVVAWTDDPGAARVAAASGRDVVAVGTGGDAQWRVRDVTTQRRSSTFVLEGPELSLDVTLQVAGAHNVADAAVVATLALQLGVDPSNVVAGLAAFQGAPRRFEYRGTWGGVDVYEDYAHLPGEIAATLRAARQVGYERITAVFQPHRVTRTIAIGDQFAPAFDEATSVIVTDIYPAGEANPTGVTGEAIERAIAARHETGRVQYCASLGSVAAAVRAWHGLSDVLVFIGAGDVASVAGELVDGGAT